MNVVKSCFEKVVEISGADWQVVSERLEHCTIKKHQWLLKQNEVEQGLYFIEEGIVRLCLEHGEKDITVGFAFAHEFISAYDSFLTRKPSAYGVQALTPCSLWKIRYEDLQEIYENTSVGQLIGRTAAENLFLKKSGRELSFLVQNAEQRYLSLFNTRPEVVKFIPLQYIASYIGVTPQALSRIRKRIS